MKPSTLVWNILQELIWGRICVSRSRILNLWKQARDIFSGFVTEIVMTQGCE